MPGADRKLQKTWWVYMCLNESEQISAALHVNIKPVLHIRWLPLLEFTSISAKSVSGPVYAIK